MRESVFLAKNTLKELHGGMALLEEVHCMNFESVIIRKSVCYTVCCTVEENYSFSFNLSSSF